MSGHRVDNVLLAGTPQVVGADKTKQVVSIDGFRVTAEDSMVMKVAVFTSGHSGTVSAILQDSPDGSTWTDVANVSITGNNVFEINLNAYNGTDVPMWPLARVVVTTSTTSGVTIDKILVTRR